MPCKFCQSTSHTLKNCDSDIGKNMCEDVKDFIQQNKFKIKEQIEHLEVFTKTQLSFMAKELDLPVKGTKYWLIFIIIRKYFRDATDHNQFRSMTNKEINQIHDAYTKFDYQSDFIRSPVPDSEMITIHVKSMIDAFYARRYGVRRYGVSISEYFDKLDEIAINKPELLSLYESELREKEHREQVIENTDLGLISRLKNFTAELLETRNNRMENSNKNK